MNYILVIYSVIFIILLITLNLLAYSPITLIEFIITLIYYHLLIYQILINCYISRINN